jgi:hypothetical protein
VGDAFGAAAVAVVFGEGAGADAPDVGALVGAGDATLPTDESKAKIIANNDCMRILRAMPACYETKRVATSVALQ